MPNYPKSRIVENRQANQDEFTIPNGQEYKNPYYTTYDGQLFTGVNPFSLNSRPLIPIIQNNTERYIGIVVASLQKNYLKVTRITKPNEYLP